VRISELEEDDGGAVFTLTVVNSLGESNYTVTVPNVEEKDGKTENF
jgi:hypothetical protein